ncbi:hypothetical protein D3C87_1164070 [compost metagenome]
MAASIAPASAALRVIGPMWSSEAASSKAPWRLTRPHVGFRPVMPLAADGKRIDPPVSVPSAPKHSPAAVATPEPLDDTPGHSVASHGLTGDAICGWWSAKAPSVCCSLPRITAPASRRRCTTVASSVGRNALWIVMPCALGTPSVHSRSFTASGTPCSGPRARPAAISVSARRASSSACASMRVA